MAFRDANEKWDAIFQDVLAVYDTWMRLFESLPEDERHNNSGLAALNEKYVIQTGKLKDALREIQEIARREAGDLSASLRYGW